MRAKRENGEHDALVAREAGQSGIAPAEVAAEARSPAESADHGPRSVPEGSSAPGHPPIPDRYKHAPKLGEYLLIAELGRGGMGKVYKAYHVPTGEIRAIKILVGEAARSRKVRTRFQREATIAQQIKHPHIVRVYGFERDPVRKVYYMTMEYMEGGSLSAIVRERGRLHWTYVLRIAKQVCQALAALHERGLVHRDVKPSNLLVDARGNVKLADMGLIRYEAEADDASQLTATGAVMGTLDYMAPEQIVDPRNTDIRSDLYALGCTLFHLLTGRPPFPEGSAYQKIQQHLSHPLPEIGLLAPDVPSAFVLIINRLTAKDPADRFQSPGQLMAALESLEKELLGAGSDPTATFEVPEELRKAVANAAQASSLDLEVTRRKNSSWVPLLLIVAGVLGVFLLGWLLVRGTRGANDTEGVKPAAKSPSVVERRKLPDLPLPR